MKDKDWTEAETSVNSPTLIRHTQRLSNAPNPNFLRTSFYSSPSPSQTEVEMYSHSIINEVMESSRRKSVWHQINKIDPNIALFSKPSQLDNNEFSFDCIPANNLLYSSTCSAQIKKIDRALRDKQHKDHIHQNKPNNNKKEIKRRPASAGNKTSVNQKISVTGLVAYKFNSLKAQKSAGFNKPDLDQKMIDQLQAANSRLYCSSNRCNKILARSSTQRYKQYSKDQKAIMEDFISDTQQYLINVVKREEENKLVYGEQGRKMDFIREYMRQQDVSYSDAFQVVSEIQKSHHPPPVEKRKIEKIERNEQRQLTGRRVPMQKKAVLVRNFHFIQ